ncbi:MAG: flavin reductase family protein [Calditrichia bacterium]
MTDTFRNFSRQLVHPVALLSVKYNDKENLATMAWISVVSSNPPLLMVAVNPKRYSHELVSKAGEFAIIVLSDQQKELSTLAGTISGRKQNKWEMEEFIHLRKAPVMIGSPLLKESRANFECKLVNQVTAGDHTLFIGEVVHMEFNEDVNPLILFEHKYWSAGGIIARYP